MNVGKEISEEEQTKIKAMIDDLMVKAKKYAEDIRKTVRENWEKTASDYGLTRRQIEEMRPAFSVCYG